jgi:hypothetical protein
MNRTVIVDKELCLDCVNFGRDATERVFTCDFGLGPIRMDRDKDGKQAVACQAYVPPLEGTEAPARSLLESRQKEYAPALGKVC